MLAFAIRNALGARSASALAPEHIFIYSDLIQTKYILFHASSHLIGSHINFLKENRFPVSFNYYIHQ